MTSIDQRQTMKRQNFDHSLSLSLSLCVRSLKIVSKPAGKERFNGSENMKKHRETGSKGHTRRSSRWLDSRSSDDHSFHTIFFSYSVISIPPFSLDQ